MTSPTRTILRWALIAAVIANVCLIAGTLLPQTDPGWTFYTPFSKPPPSPAWLRLDLGLEWIGSGVWMSAVVLCALLFKLGGTGAVTGSDKRLLIVVFGLLLPYAVYIVRLLSMVYSSVVYLS